MLCDIYFMIRVLGDTQFDLGTNKNEKFSLQISDIEFLTVRY